MQFVPTVKYINTHKKHIHMGRWFFLFATFKMQQSLSTISIYLFENNNLGADFGMEIL